VRKGPREGDAAAGSGERLGRSDGGCDEDGERDSRGDWRGSVSLERGHWDRRALLAAGPTSLPDGV
jgi:hypothetical protein